MPPPMRITEVLASLYPKSVKNGFSTAYNSADYSCSFGIELVTFTKISVVYIQYNAKKNYHLATWSYFCYVRLEIIIHQGLSQGVRMQ